MVGKLSAIAVDAFRGSDWPSLTSEELVGTDTIPWPPFEGKPALGLHKGGDGGVCLPRSGGMHSDA